jgi:threonine dehydrogenase-like Zn-dependent dehydrogenase
MLPLKSATVVHIIVIAWLYVTILMAATEPSLVGGVLTFLVYGLGPLALFVYLFRRRRKPSVRELADSPHARNSQQDE